MTASESPDWSLPPLAAVLAGGRGSRLGRPKSREKIGGRTLVERAVDSLRQVLPEVVVVGADASSGAAGEVEVVPDLRPGLGPLAGIQAALTRAGGRAAFVLACDLPFAGPELIRYLLDRKVDGKRSRDSVVVPCWRGRLQPLCALYGPGSLSRVDARLRRGELAVHGLLDDLEASVVAIGPGSSCYRPELLLNVNREEDLALAVEIDARRREIGHG